MQRLHNFIDSNSVKEVSNIVGGPGIKRYSCVGGVCPILRIVRKCDEETKRPHTSIATMSAGSFKLSLLSIQSRYVTTTLVVSVSCSNVIYVPSAIA
jgi:hypothetical protein